MEFGPILHQAQGPLGQAALEDFARLNVDLGRLPAILSMKMGWWMVQGIHANNDPIEARNLRHGLPRISKYPAFSPASKPFCFRGCIRHRDSQTLNEGSQAVLTSLRLRAFRIGAGPIRPFQRVGDSAERLLCSRAWTTIRPSVSKQIAADADCSLTERE
jgi:hypothetical protein